jgi:hypothetical protein
MGLRPTEHQSGAEGALQVPTAPTVRIAMPQGKDQMPKGRSGLLTKVWDLPRIVCAAHGEAGEAALVE